MDELTLNNIKTLGIDMIKNANSGHSGIVLGAAPILYTLFAKHIIINPNDPKWINRDRFVMSAGHGSALLYSILFMAGYLEINDLKKFRQINSKTPGHPELGKPGIDITTGLLGEGLASAVGMAIAERKLNQDTNGMIDHKIYVLCGDGDLMEGVANEAVSIAGNLKLNNLIVLYDSNGISVDDNTINTFKENTCLKFESMGWDSILVKSDNLKEIDKAISKAKKNNKPTIIEIKTTIGKGSTIENTSQVHGSVLTDEDIDNIKNKFNIPKNPFYVNDDLRSNFQKQIFERMKPYYDNWSNNYKKYTTLSNEEKRKFNFIFEDENINIDNIDFEINEEKEALRISNHKILNKLAPYIPSIIVGSADLASSTKIKLDNYSNITYNDFSGKNIQFGVREHAMSAILNGMALYNYKPMGSTFLVFSDFMKPGIRMSSIMNLPVTYIFTHDSVNIGEDGITHQPIEQLESLRSIPNFTVYRPCDTYEIIGCYKEILKRKEPSALIISKIEVPVINKSIPNIELGAYIIKDYEKIDGIIISTGTDVHTAIYISNSLEKEYNLKLRVVSMPSRELFEKQSNEYKENILPKGYKKFVIEAGTKQGYEGYVYSDKYLCTIENFGTSGKKDDVLKYCSFDFESLKEKIKKSL